MTRHASAGIAILLTVLCIATAAFGADNRIIRTAKSEYTILSGYGITHRGFGATRSQVQTFDTIARFGYYLSDDIGSGWYKGRHQLLLELPLHLVVDPKISPMTGGYVLGCWKFTSSTKPSMSCATKSTTARPGCAFPCGASFRWDSTAAPAAKRLP